MMNKRDLARWISSRDQYLATIRGQIIDQGPDGFLDLVEKLTRQAADIGQEEDSTIDPLLRHCAVIGLFELVTSVHESVYETMEMEEENEG